MAVEEGSQERTVEEGKKGKAVAAEGVRHLEGKQKAAEEEEQCLEDSLGRQAGEGRRAAGGDGAGEVHREMATGREEGCVWLRGHQQERSVGCRQEAVWH